MNRNSNGLFGSKYLFFFVPWDVKESRHVQQLRQLVPGSLREAPLTVW